MAPPDVLIQYLVLFQRTLNVTVDAALHTDPDAMLFCGYLADALHNAPSMLLNYGEDSWSTPERIAEGIDDLLRLCEEGGAPPHVLQLCREITRTPTLPAELGLSVGGADLNTAPAEAMGRYLRLLKDFCLWVRFIRSVGEPPNYWHGLETRWDERAFNAGRANGQLAAILQPIPHALAHWGEWDEAAFWNALWTRTQERYGDEGQKFWKQYWPPGWQPSGADDESSAPGASN